MLALALAVCCNHNCLCLKLRELCKMFVFLFVFFTPQWLNWLLHTCTVTVQQSWFQFPQLVTAKCCLDERALDIVSIWQKLWHLSTHPMYHVELECANNAAILPMLPVLSPFPDSFLPSYLPTYLPACYLFACLLLPPALPFICM